MAFVLLLRTEAFLLSSAQRVPTGRFIDTMKENGLIEFRWHGRGGQGAKTACLLLADAAFCSGKYVQGFPEYGPERMGAPITAYNRISDVRCSVHCNIENPDYVVVVDETLLDSVDVTHGLSPEGAVIVNTAHSPGAGRGEYAPSMPAASPRRRWAKTSPTPPCWPLPSKSAACWRRQSSRKTWRIASITNSPRSPRSSPATWPPWSRRGRRYRQDDPTRKRH